MLARLRKPRARGLDFKSFYSPHVIVVDVREVESALVPPGTFGEGQSVGDDPKSFLRARH